MSLIDSMLGELISESESEVFLQTGSGQGKTGQNISKNMRNKWKRHQIIPFPLLVWLYQRGFLPSMPSKGLGYEVFLDWLYHGPFESDVYRDNSRDFYVRLVDHELATKDWPKKSEIFLKCDRGEFLSRQQIRDHYPGAMI